MSNEFGNGEWGVGDNSAQNGQVRKDILLGEPTEFGTLYFVEIAILISFAVIMFSAYVLSPTLAAFAFVAMAVASVVYLVYVMKLKRYSDTFKEAGIYYLVYFILYFVHNNVRGLLLLLVSIAYFVFLILYIIKFCDGCTELLKNRDESLASSWNMYKTVMLYAYGLAVLFEVLAYVPGLKIVAGIAYILIALAQMGFYFWHIILLKKTDEAIRTRSFFIQG